MNRFVLALMFLAATVAVGLTPAVGLAQQEHPCPKDLAALATCWTVQDSAGAIVVIAKPKDWNGVLVVHAHGGPRLPAPTLEKSWEDLERFDIVVKAGYAWANSTYRRGGYGVRMAVEDTESARKIALGVVGQPRRVILHGQSWGGNVAAKLHEVVIAQTPKGQRPPYDGVLLTSGVLGGGTHGYDYRIDLRAVYQFYCNNHPRPDEPQYPLWMGLPANAKMDRKDLEARVDECTGVKHYPESRTPQQKQNLANILNATRIPEKTLTAHLSWATSLFQDIVTKRLDGKNPFGNQTVKYTGTTDDAALNKGVARYTPDPAAVAQLAEDSDLSGALRVPELTMHAIDDPTAFVEHESRYRDAVVKAGHQDLLQQTFVDFNEHSYMADPIYAALLQELVTWVDSGKKPSPQAVADACTAMQGKFPGDCRFKPDYTPQPYAARVYPR